MRLSRELILFMSYFSIFENGIGIHIFFLFTSHGNAAISMKHILTMSRWTITLRPQIVPCSLYSITHCLQCCFASHQCGFLSLVFIFSLIPSLPQSTSFSALTRSSYKLSVSSSAPAFCRHFFSLPKNSQRETTSGTSAISYKKALVFFICASFSTILLQKR